MATTGKASLYFHIPFCRQKCPYCHFYSRAIVPEAVSSFISALSLEWERKKDLLQGYEICSIYFGGGTPFLLAPDFFYRLLQTIQSSCVLSPHCEITLEANPETISLNVLLEMRKAGINRISLGVQALDDDLLLILGRKHSAKKALQAIDEVFKAQFTNLSIDLIYDIPHQTPKQWEKTLCQILQWPIPHISLYNLTFDPPSQFFKERETLHPLLPSEQDSLKMLQDACSSMRKHGYDRYEISAFAYPNFASVHNLGYWTGRPFLGFGPSAFSYWNKTRSQNCFPLNRYLQKLNDQLSPMHFAERLSYPRNVQELLAIGLRVAEGVCEERLQKEEGSIPLQTKQILFKWVEMGYLEKQGTFWKLTQKGLLFHDSIAQEIISISE